MSSHLCLAVEISAPDDPYVAPSLANQWPGWSSGTDLRVLADNNKAQRNMGLSTTPARGMGMKDDYFAIIHNGAPFTRDMEVAFQLEPVTARKLRPILTVAGQDRREVSRSGSFVLKDMRPGENRWVDVQFDAARVEPKDFLPIQFFELFGGVSVNGFTVAARGGTLEQAIREKLELHRSVFARLAALRFEGADREAVWAARLRTKRKLPPAEYLAGMRRGALRKLIRSVEKFGRYFPLDDAIKELYAAVDAKQATRTVLAHSALLNRLDAALTRDRLEQGDPVDIVTIIAWQRDLYRGSARLAKLPCGAKVADLAEGYVDAIGKRKITNEQYPRFLRDSAACFAETASALGSESSKARVEALSKATDDLASREKAHRELLLALEQTAR